MRSFRSMYTITVPFPRILTIPNGFNHSREGKRPLSVVVHTPVDSHLMRLHEVPGCSIWSLRDADVDLLLAELGMEEAEHLELESHSNTDLIIRAYNWQGYEKVYGIPRPYTHKTLHFRVEFGAHSRDSLVVRSHFDECVVGMGPTPYKLTTSLGEHEVKLSGLDSPSPGGRCGLGGFVLWDHQWRDFCARHALHEGMILIFQHSGAPRTFKFDVWFYGQDGSEISVMSRRPEMFCPEESSFYRRPSSKYFQGPGLRLRDSFMQANRPRMWAGVITLSTLAGNFDMVRFFELLPDGPPHTRHSIRGDWDAVFQANGFGNSKLKFQLSLNNTRDTCVMFVVECVDTAEGGYTSSEDETSYEDSDDESV